MTSETNDTPQKGTIRMLFAIHCGPGKKPADLHAALVLAYADGPHDAGFALGDDLTMGEGEFGDTNVNPAEFHHADHLTTGLWVAEWDWEMKYNEDDDVNAPAYSAERWSRPTHADLVAFDMVPADV